MSTHSDKISRAASGRQEADREDSPFSRVLSEYSLRSKRLRNRVVHSSMSTYYTQGGFVAERLIEYHRCRAQGGAGMIVTGALAGLSSQAGGYRVHAFSDDHMDGLRRWAAAVEGEDTRLLGQLMAPGRARHHPGRNDRAVGPSPLPDDLSWTVPHQLSTDDIRRMIDEFAQTAHRLQRAGFSGVEISGGHGHLFHQFMSPWCNRREDEYGGDREGRLRLVGELVEAIRTKCTADWIIGLKVPGDDGVPGGIGPEESEHIIRHLAAHAELDYF